MLVGGGIVNGNTILKLIEKRLDNLDRTVEEGFKDIRDDRSRTVQSIAALDTRLALAEREVDYRPCDEHKVAIKQVSKQIQEVTDQVKHKLAWTPMVVAVSVGVMAFLLSKWGGSLFL